MELRSKKARNTSHVSRYIRMYSRFYCNKLNAYFGRAVDPAVSRWLATAAARVRVRVACGVCGGQSGNGADFLRVLRFSLPVIPPIFSNIVITRGWHNRPIDGRSADWTQLDSTPRYTN
jgi:hypothetical protein